ncbi:hypothetical protein BKA70DRAFT_1291097, partial [Coprinopsis sp. MPI-PUGE-AT-0042]
MTMPNWLKPVAKLLRPNKSGKAQSSLQEPNLPWEIVFNIVDEYFAEASKLDRYIGLTSIALTCHALAAYCRPLVFHSVCVGSATSRSDYHQHSPRALGTLTRRSPEVLGMVRRLSLQFGGPLCSLKKAEWRMWTPILTALFPQLQTLQLYVVWRTMPQETREELLWMLKRADKVTHLILDTCVLPFIWPPFLPTGLKRLTITGWPTVITRIVPPTSPSPTHSAVKLQALSFSTSSLSLQYFNSAGPDSIAGDGLDGTSLQHLKLGVILDASYVTSHIRYLRPFSMLHCLHFAIDPGLEPWALAQWDFPFDIGSLTSLKVLEIGIESMDFYASLEWLSKSLIRGTSEGQDGRVEDRLSVALLLSACDMAKERGRPDNWRVAVANIYPNLLQINLLVFGTETACCRPPVVDRDISHDPGPDHSTPVFLASLTSSKDLVEPIQYSSLWESCLCSGWW